MWFGFISGTMRSVNEKTFTRKAVSSASTRDAWDLTARPASYMRMQSCKQVTLAVRVKHQAVR